MKDMADNRQIGFELNISILEIKLSSTPSTNAPLSTSEPSTTQKSSNIEVDFETRAINTFQIRSNDISYRAEGNANIVLAIPQRCQVLRLPKIHKRLPNVHCSTDSSKGNRIYYAFKYIESISKLFGLKSSRPFLVEIEFCNRNAFDEWLRHQRPNERINSKGEKDDFDFNYALLYHDACSLNLKPLNSDSMQSEVRNVLEVEIKPKQGWNICTLPNWLLDEFGINHDLPKKCRFSAMQFLKVKGHQVNENSKYCPLDLFSGDEVSMRSAIQHLIKSPQNNFRVFHNGTLEYSDQHQELDLHRVLNTFFSNKMNNMNSFISLLTNILLHGSVRIDAQGQAQSQVKKSTMGVEHCGSEDMNCSSQLPSNSVLKRVLDLQLLAKKTIASIATKYKGMSNDSMVLMNTSNFPRASLSRLCEKLDQTNQIVLDEIDYEHLRMNCYLTDEELYEIGATALDCSIMLTMQHSLPQRLDTGFPEINVNGEQFIVNAIVFDLDPKPHLRHYLKYVQKTRDSYLALQQSFKT